MPPFKAAVDAGVASIMPSFNTLDNIPMSGNKKMLTEVLRQQWGYKGITVSDWSAIHEMIAHGFAENGSHAANLSIHAGMDLDMMASDYMKYLADHVKNGTVNV